MIQKECLYSIQFIDINQRHLILNGLWLATQLILVRRILNNLLYYSEGGEFFIWYLYGKWPGMFSRLSTDKTYLLRHRIFCDKLLASI